MPTSYEQYGDPRLKQLLEDVWKIHCRKAHDYVPIADPNSNLRASEKLGIPAWKGVLLRMNDKINRLNEFARTGVLANEGAEDSFLDLGNYSLLALILLRETRRVQASPVLRDPGNATPGDHGGAVEQLTSGPPDEGREVVLTGQLRNRPEVVGGGPAQATGEVDPGRGAPADPEPRGGFTPRPDGEWYCTGCGSLQEYCHCFVPGSYATARIDPPTC